MSKAEAGAGRDMTLAFRSASRLSRIPAADDGECRARAGSGAASTTICGGAHGSYAVWSDEVLHPL